MFGVISNYWSPVFVCRGFDLGMLQDCVGAKPEQMTFGSGPKLTGTFT